MTIRPVAWLALTVAALMLTSCTDNVPDQGDDSATEESFVPTVPYRLATTQSPGLDGLQGIAVDAAGRIYLAHAAGVAVLDSAWRRVADLPTPGAAMAVAVSADGRVFVAGRQQVTVFGPQGEMLATWGTAGQKAGQLSLVTGIAVSDNNVWLADAGNRVVHRFDATGDFVAGFGLRDAATGAPGIICPSPHLDCTVDADGSLWTANPGRWRVEHYDLNGRLVGAWGRQGPGPREFQGCCNPSNLHLLSGGGFVTSEKGIARVKVHSADGEVVAVLGKEFFAEGSVGLDLASDAAGRIYVVEPERGQVLVFEKAGGS